MNTKPQYRVATAGLDERDVRLIEIVFRHSHYNAVDYRLVSAGDEQADILIINPFQADGLRTLSRVRARGHTTPLITAVPVGMKSPARHAIRIERLTLQLLPVLNQLVESEFGSPAPQVFRMTDSHGRQIDRATLDQRLDQASPVVIGSQRQQTAADAEPTASELMPSTLSPETVTASSVSDATTVTESGFAGSTVITTLSPETGFGPSVRAVPVPPMSILTESGAPAAAAQSMPQPDAGPQPRNEAADDNDPDAVNVLVVDDSPTVRRQMQIALARMGLNCIAVAGGKQALEQLDQRNFALALVDVVMGDMDGYQLTREIRRQSPGLPVIILTSRASPFDLARGALSGCSSYLVKPVPLKRLHSVIARRLQKNNPVAAARLVSGRTEQSVEQRQQSHRHN